MIPRNTPSAREDGSRNKREAQAARREALVKEMVNGAILPRLLARKDDGAFDRGPNVLRFPRGGEI